MMPTSPAHLAWAATVLLFISQTAIAENLTIPLWSDGAPGAPSNLGQEKDITTPKDPLVAGHPLKHLTNVTRPTVTIYRPLKGKDTGAAIVVFPGGGYRILAIDLEGTEICEWLNSIGITAALVKYRVPEAPGISRYAAPLQDAQRAVGIVRSRAKKWGIDPGRIGVLGFSAGGHLSAVLSNHPAARTYPQIDSADQFSCRPDFALLIYPAYLSVNDKGESLAPEVQIAASPPTFIVQAENDNPFIDGTLLYYSALKHAGIPAEMHIYSTGGHGYGLRKTAEPVTEWPQLAERWLRTRGVLR